MKQLLVIGGSDAGMSAALRAREVDPAWRVTVVVADRFPNYSICGLPFLLSGETPRVENLAHRTQADMESEGIDLLLDTRAERIDPDEHRVLVRGADRAARLLDYDRVLIGTGAVPARPALPGIDAPGVYQLHSMADSFAIRDHLESQMPRRAVIIGAGYIGLEMADALRQRGLSVTLCESAPNVLGTVDSQLGLLVQGELERHAVAVHTSRSISRIEARSDELVVHASDGMSFPADLVLVVTGVRPDAQLGRACGVESGERGALRVNRRMQTNVADVYAAGDCIETHHRLMREPGYLPLGTTAHKQGRIAGENAVGGSVEFGGILGTQVVKIFGIVVGRTGLRTEEASPRGLRPGHCSDDRSGSQSLLSRRDGARDSCDR